MDKKIIRRTNYESPDGTTKTIVVYSDFSSEELKPEVKVVKEPKEVK